MTAASRSSIPEPVAFGTALAFLIVLFFCETLLFGKVLSPADVLSATAGFQERHGPDYEPRNRLLIDPVLQFQPWIAFNRESLRAGRLPLWNPHEGCGAPHLANGQSAVFDPFLLIAYIGPLPESFAWVAAARLWFAGLGMFLLAKALGLGDWGRWFAGLTFPFTGFLVVWLLYPVTSSAVWLPWLLLATLKLLERPDRRRVAGLAAAVGGCLLGGHVQTSAHALLLTGLFALWRWDRSSVRSLAIWSVGVALGVLVAAIEIVPLGVYLSRSPVWTDRAAERKPPWSLEKPRLLDSVCVALPYAYGSQRRGHPNIARALGVHNLNESAGGFAGLATLLWLAPLAWSARRERPVVKFLLAVALFGFGASLRLPPFDNLLRMVPVLNVTDNRRLSLWVAFALPILGGIGLDALATMRVTPRWRWWGLAWGVAAMACLVPVFAVGRFEARIRETSRVHYAKAAAETPGADPQAFRDRADRQTRSLLRFVPRYYATASIQLLALAGMLGAIRGFHLRRTVARPMLFAVVMADLFGFGFGLDPAIALDEHEYVPNLIQAIQFDPDIPRGRILGLGAELPPNTAMRFGLSDIRNYDSVELSSTLEWFAPLFQGDAARSRSSRREAAWEGVRRAREILGASGVTAIVSAVEPPPGLFERVEHRGAVWLTRLDAAPLLDLSADIEAPGRYLWENLSGWAFKESPGFLTVREMAAPGWRAYVDGREVPLLVRSDPFLHVPLPVHARRVELRYDPLEVRVGLALSIFGVLGVVFALTRRGEIRSTRIVTSRLGRSRATGLRSMSWPLPDDPTGD